MIKDEESLLPFLSDTASLIFKASVKSGRISYLGGSLRSFLDRNGHNLSRFKNIYPLFEDMGVERHEVVEFYDSLRVEKKHGKESSRKIKLKLGDQLRWFLWIGSINYRGTYMQGQLLDIHQNQILEEKFADLRRMTYGTSYLGAKVGLGKEDARERDLTVMFIDAVDSTTRLFNMTLEEAKKYVEDLSLLITDMAHKYDGYVDKFMGDGAMVIWGYRIQPRTFFESNDLQAVLAGKFLLDQCKKYNEGKPKEQQISFRIGIASGEVISGVFDNPHRKVFTAIGRPVNIAARLEKRAKPDSMLVTHEMIERLKKTCPKELAVLECTNFKLKGVPDVVRACLIR